VIILLLTIYFLKKESPTPEIISLKNWKVTTESAFRKDQMRFERVRKAYAEKEVFIKKLLTSKGIHSFDYDLFLRAFKKEEILEVWIKEKSNTSFRLLTSYTFCKNSGKLGPKRKEGDHQIPEGLYRINHFNPKSNFLLSLRVNYPNASDKVLSHPTTPGSDIYVHGGCQTVGCIPITNEKIQELYILAVEAHEADAPISIHIFPTKNWSEILKVDHPHFAFWKNLKVGFDLFEENRTISAFEVSEDGAYKFR
ncbi:MAG: L,D-transpeptidase family protein, partial [Bacteroidota bacterium]